ncbi:amino acid adenylation domain-containing protein [Catenulispora sp. EB89]|uniref:AMP-binding protein n=1 Tax=Catenulispora sp. EB89 TaxID=3156257 RepID=UPI003511A0C5
MDDGTVSLWAAAMATAELYPERLAVLAPDGEATYGELLGCAYALAARFVAEGVGPRDRVGVAVAPGRTAIAAAMAAMMCGAAFVPVDPAHPDAFIQSLLQASSASIAVSAPGRASLGLPTITADEVEPLFGAGVRDVFPALNRDVAYVIHTSGSTGVPKGIAVSHRSALNVIAEIDRIAPSPKYANGSWWASPSFDVSIWEAWAPLQRGGAVVVVPDHARLDAEELVGFLDAQGAASMLIMPGLLPSVRDALVNTDLGKGFRCLLTGGEPVRLGVCQDILAARPELVVLNGYGPAETTIASSLYRVPAVGGDRNGRTPIGLAVAGNRIHLVDSSGAPTTNEVGELLVAGINVARGYLNGQAGGFTTEPGGTGEPAYRTGDLVRRLPDGNLLFESRVDNQLKVRGHRVEPGEVEAALHRVGRFHEVVVASRNGNRDLVAYVVPRPGTDVDPDDTILNVRKLLPAYAVPSMIVRIGAVPQTRNGKTDYAALAALAVDKGDREPNPVADPLLQAVLDCFFEYAQGTGGSPDSGFIEVGGTSLGAIQAAADLRRRLGKRVSAADILRAPSAHALARLLADATEATSAGPLTGTMRGPLTPAQLAMWLHEQVTQDDLRYVEVVAFDFPTGLDTLRLVGAIRTAAARHLAFGARIVEESSGPHWSLGERMVAVGCPERAVIAGSAEHAVRIAEAFGAFDLSTGPLMRAEVIRCGPDSGTVVFSWHHLVIDGWSLRRFLAEVGRCYRDDTYEPASEPRTVCDLAALSAAAQADPGFAARVSARADRIRGSGPIRFAWPGSVSAEVEPDRGLCILFHLTGLENEALLARARQFDVTIHTIYLSAFQDSVQRVTGLRDFNVAIAVSERDVWGAGDVAGCLVNTVLVPAADPDLSTANYVRSVGTAVKTALADVDIPFSAVMRELLRGIKPRPSNVPQLYFTMDQAATLDLGSIEGRPRYITQRSPKFEMTFRLDVGATDVHGELAFQPTAVPPGVAQAVVDEFVAAVARLCLSH